MIDLVYLICHKYYRYTDNNRLEVTSVTIIKHQSTRLSQNLVQSFDGNVFQQFDGLGRTPRDHSFRYCTFVSWFPWATPDNFHVGSEAKEHARRSTITRYAALSSFDILTPWLTGTRRLLALQARMRPRRTNNQCSLPAAVRL